jgi:hypothetical protein
MGLEVDGTGDASIRLAEDLEPRNALIEVVALPGAVLDNPVDTIAVEHPVVIGTDGHLQRSREAWYQELATRTGNMNSCHEVRYMAGFYLALLSPQRGRRPRARVS